MFDTYNNIWDKIYSKYPFYYGKSYSKCAKLSSKYIVENSNILEIGSGYCRDAIYFTEFNIKKIYCIEKSKFAIQTAINQIQDKKKIKIINEDFFNYNINFKFEIIYSNYFFHLFLEKERNKAFAKVIESLNNNGLFISSFLSIFDNDYLKGPEIEYNTFKQNNVRIYHFFNEHEIKGIINKMNLEIIDFIPTEEIELIADKKKKTMLYFVCAKKIY